LPRNVEIEAALAERQRLFGGGLHSAQLVQQRRAALQAMQRLTLFNPRLVGAVLAGTATATAPVQLHLFADAPEPIALGLLDAHVPHELAHRRVRLTTERAENLPCVYFAVDAQAVEATVFPVDGIRQAPLSPVDGRPMRRADISEVRLLLDVTA
jgi:hypothetical protein